MKRSDFSHAPVRHRGFSLVAAIFVLVILGLLGAFMVTMSVLQHSTVSYAVQGARAYQAALSGIEWATQRAIETGACPGAVTFPVVAGPDTFNVAVACASSAHVEPQSNVGAFNVFVITATASSGAFGTPYYFSRSAQATVTNAQPPP